MGAYYGLILDALIVILLLVTIIYAVMLNRRLTRVRESRTEMERATRSFVDSVQKADSGVKALRRTADEVGNKLQRDIDRAQKLHQELTYLVEAAESVAGRLEAVAETRRPSTEADDMAGNATGSGRRGQAARGGARAGKPSSQDILKAIETLR